MQKYLGFGQIWGKHLKIGGKVLRILLGDIGTGIEEKV